MSDTLRELEHAYAAKVLSWTNGSTSKTEEIADVLDDFLRTALALQSAPDAGQTAAKDARKLVELPDYGRAYIDATGEAMCGAPWGYWEARLVALWERLQLYETDCPACEGQGGDPESNTTCPKCEGLGRVSRLAAAREREGKLRETEPSWGAICATCGKDYGSHRVRDLACPDHGVGGHFKARAAFARDAPKDERSCDNCKLYIMGLGCKKHHVDCGEPDFKYWQLAPKDANMNPDEKARYEGHDAMFSEAPKEQAHGNVCYRCKRNTGDVDNYTIQNHSGSTFWAVDLCINCRDKVLAAADEAPMEAPDARP